MSKRRTRGCALIAFGARGADAVVVWTNFAPLSSVMGEVGAAEGDQIGLSLGHKDDRPDNGVWWAVVREDVDPGRHTADGWMGAEQGFEVVSWIREAVDVAKAPRVPRL